MLRKLIIGYCCGVRSERRLCEEVELHLACRNLIHRLSLEPPHILIVCSLRSPNAMDHLLATESQEAGNAE